MGCFGICAAAIRPQKFKSFDLLIVVYFLYSDLLRLRYHYTRLCRHEQFGL